MRKLQGEIEKAFSVKKSLDWIRTRRTRTRAKLEEEDSSKDLPNITLTDKAKISLVYIAHEEGLPLDEALTQIVEFYRTHKKMGISLKDFEEVIRLRKMIRNRNIDLLEVEYYSIQKKKLAEKGLSISDVKTLVELLDFLNNHGRKLNTIKKFAKYINELEALLKKQNKPDESSSKK